MGDLKAYYHSVKRFIEIFDICIHYMNSPGTRLGEIISVSDLNEI